ncbi:MAG: MerR family DNA-binding protein [Actinomycetota bacterium]
MTAQPKDLDHLGALLEQAKNLGASHVAWHVGLPVFSWFVHRKRFPTSPAMSGRPAVPGASPGFRDRGEAPCPYVRHVIDEQSAAIDERIRELQRLQAELRKLKRVAEKLADAPPDGRCVCHILENASLGPTKQTA